MWGSRWSNVRIDVFSWCLPPILQIMKVFSNFLPSHIFLLAEVPLWALPNPGQVWKEIILKWRSFKRRLFKNGWLGGLWWLCWLGNGQQPPCGRWWREKGHSHIWKSHSWIQDRRIPSIYTAGCGQTCPCCHLGWICFSAPVRILLCSSQHSNATVPLLVPSSLQVCPASSESWKGD